MYYNGFNFVDRYGKKEDSKKVLEDLFIAAQRCFDEKAMSEETFYNQRKDLIDGYCMEMNALSSKDLFTHAENLKRYIDMAGIPELTGFLSALFVSDVEYLATRRQYPDYCFQSLIYMKEHFFEIYINERTRSYGLEIGKALYNKNTYGTDTSELPTLMARPIRQQIDFTVKLRKDEDISEYLSVMPYKKDKNASYYMIQNAVGCFAKRLINFKELSVEKRQHALLLSNLSEKYADIVFLSDEHTYKEDTRNLITLMEICLEKVPDEFGSLTFPQLAHPIALYFDDKKFDEEILDALNTKTVSPKLSSMIDKKKGCDPIKDKPKSYSGIKAILTLVGISIFLELRGIKVIEFFFAALSFTTALPIVGFIFILIPLYAIYVLVKDCYEPDHIPLLKSLLEAPPISSYSRSSSYDDDDDDDKSSSSSVFDYHTYTHIPKETNENVHVDAIASDMWHSED